MNFAYVVVAIGFTQPDEANDVTRAIYSVYVGAEDDANAAALVYEMLTNDEKECTFDMELIWTFPVTQHDVKMLQAKNTPCMVLAIGDSRGVEENPFFEPFVMLLSTDDMERTKDEVLDMWRREYPEYDFRAQSSTVTQMSEEVRLFLKKHAHPDDDDGPKLN